MNEQVRLTLHVKGERYNLVRDYPEKFLSSHNLILMVVYRQMEQLLSDLAKALNEKTDDCGSETSS